MICCKCNTNYMYLCYVKLENPSSSHPTAIYLVKKTLQAIWYAAADLLFGTISVKHIFVYKSEYTCMYSMYTFENHLIISYPYWFMIYNCRLAGCKITEKSCEIVASALQSANTPLRELDLSQNDLQKSLEKLLSALQSPNCKLETLRSVIL